MAVSLESRIPLLDHRIVEFVWSLPPLLRCGAPGTKTPLRNILYQHVPRHLVDRPKMGFSIPLAAWLRGPLRVWVEDLLAASDLQREGFLSPGAVQRTWREHLTGQRDNGDILWNIVTFQRWLVERRAPLNGETSLQDPVIHAQAF
jgi:asparagine synthase (glutamine-hydrolysing)